MTKLLLYFVILVSVALATSQEKNSLELVHVVFRHGDRTPEKYRLYPYDPHINVTYYPIGNGQLTNAGKRRLYLLGKALKKRYGNFLGTFTVDTVDARSTDYRRTKMSLQLVLASLFPPENELIWEKHLKWQPVPFTYWPIEKDHVLGEAYENCPRYLKLYYDYMETLDRRNLYGNYSDVAQYLERHAGINATTREMAEIYFTLRVELENGLELPDWTRQVYPQVLYQLAHLEYHVATATSEMKRLSSGFLLNKIITDTKLKMQNLLPQNRKMFLYSGHEYNIVFLMKLLGIYYSHIPPYGAYILVEIHNVKGVRSVRIFYQDYTMGKPKRMRLPKCQRFCRFERLVKLYQKYLPESEEECERVEE
jgi:prostatic aicd phosphatase